LVTVSTLQMSPGIVKAMRLSLPSMG
jgi:hypothetical protein